MTPPLDTIVGLGCIALIAALFYPSPSRRQARREKASWLHYVKNIGSGK